jgi:cytochrome c-type biogenesis protein CcmH/NrfG
MIARVTLAVCALAVAAWLGVSLRSAHYLDQATKIAVGSSLKGARPRLGPIVRSLHRAEHWTPDTRPQVLLADVDLAAHRPERAIERVRPVLRAEPQNIEAWFVLVLAGHQRHDARGAAAAQRRIDKLSPLAAR